MAAVLRFAVSVNASRQQHQMNIDDVTTSPAKSVGTVLGCCLSPPSPHIGLPQHHIWQRSLSLRRAVKISHRGDQSLINHNGMNETQPATVIHTACYFSFFKQKFSKIGSNYGQNVEVRIAENPNFRTNFECYYKGCQFLPRDAL